MVSGGTLQLGDGTPSHDGVLSANYGITNNASLVYNLYGQQTFSGSVGGWEAWRKPGSVCLS